MAQRTTFGGVLLERQRSTPCVYAHACDKNWCQPAAGWRRAGSAGQSHARQGTRLPLLTNCVYAYRNTEPGLPTRVPRWKSLHYDKLATAPVECHCTCSRAPTAQPGASVRDHPCRMCLAVGGDAPSAQHTIVLRAPLLERVPTCLHDPGRTRTCNLWFRRATPYPLGHRALRLVAERKT